ncbi:MAG: PIN domain-containing protein [Benjaminiella poitrasii]|nr:MAG: PIN domain-containing protein [Benjaminiella poitrasii]
MNSEDMEFMDIDGPEFIYDVNNEIKNIRDQLHNDHHNYDVFYGSPMIQQQLVPEYYAEIAVLDTNFLLSKLGFLDALIDLANKNPYSLLVILPWVVIRELDGLKSGRADVAVSSRNAMRFIELRLREKQMSLRGQKKNEVSDKALLKNDRAKGDDLILDCCMYFQQSTQDKAGLLSNDRAPSKITLLSNDRNLCIKAMVHDIQTISAGSILEMEGLLNRITSTKSSNNINLQQQSEPEDLVIP